MRKTIIAGNWKMNCIRSEAKSLVEDLKVKTAGNTDAVDVLVCPPFTSLTLVAELLEGTGIKVGGQNLFWKDKGAYTGQISAPMLVDAGCEYVVIGHSEPRGRFGVAEPDFTPEILAFFGDSDATVNRKLHAALKGGLKPIVCVGETLAERQAGNTDSVISTQTTAALKDITAEQAANLIFAYEPVWAIGTGEVCEAGEADRVCGVVRSTVAALYGPEVAEQARVQYGGSVKPDNAVDLLSRPNIDGALVGGASLKATDFAAIIAAAPELQK